MESLVQIEITTAKNLATVTTMLRNFPHTDREYNLGKQAAYDVTLRIIRQEIARQNRIIENSLLELQTVA